MEIAALSEIRPETPANNRSPLLAESQLFAQLIDQYSASQQNTPAERDFVDQPAQDRERDREEGPTDDQDSERPSTMPHEAPELAITLGLLNGAEIPTPYSTATTAQGQFQIAPTNGAKPALQPAVTDARIRAAHPTLQSEAPASDNKPKAAPKLGNASASIDRPGIQVTAETTPQLRSQAPTTVSAAATSIQDTAKSVPEAATAVREVAVNETSLRAGRDEALSRHPQQAAQLQPRTDQPKSTGTNTAGPDQTPSGVRTNAGQAASPPQTLSAVSQTPTLVAAPLVGVQPAGMPFAGNDLMQLDLAVQRGTASQPSPPVQAKTAMNNPTTAARARTAPGQQVAMQIREAAKAGADHIRIQLQPADLGKVDVRLTIVEESVQAVITVDRPETLEQLQRDSRQLLEALENAGLQADSNSLTFQHREPNGQGMDGNKTGSQANSPGDGDKTADHTPPETIPSRAPRHDGLVSIEA